MARRVNNTKGFLVIAMNVAEAVAICKFGVEDIKNKAHLLICDRCNKRLDNIPINDEVYYVAALNHLLCINCYREWIAYAKRYDEDIPYEERYFNKYAKKLNLIV